ncbi:hypothetical protein [Sphingobacterium pedocola]|uniref:Uncharacterized protein n=1 Tax=Sphingobacterium pedocola TaxID=2082722 RepID=A0ABR9TD10_9SPHI|nr:hypothetical protein [Sphingobacterium pedocola]MBE8723248.1 hypothetical protein [Sphingobacterium pedocola]
MKNFTYLVAIIGLLLATFVSCKEKDVLDRKGEIPSFAVTSQGLTIADGAIQVPVTQATTITIDYTVTTSSAILQFVQTVNGIEKLVSEASGKEKFAGALTIDVPYENKVIALKFYAKDKHGQEVFHALSIEVNVQEGSSFSGESGGISWEADELSDGSILTLSDAESRFGIKLNPLPMYFFDFSAGSAAPHAVYSRKNGVGTIIQTVGATSTEQIPPGKAQSWKAPLKDLTYGSSVVKIKDTDFAPGVSIFVRRYWTHDGNTEGHDRLNRFNHKLCRLSPNNGINPYYQYDRLLMEQAPTNFAKYWNGATFHTPFVRTWVLDEVRYVASSAIDVEDASIHLRRNGAFVSALVNSTSHTTAKPGRWESLAIDQVVNLSEVPAGFAVYYDMLAVDDSEQRVMLTNNADLSLATEKEYLPATVWVDNEIQVYLRQGTFTSIQGKYVCIQGVDGNQIGVGIQMQ